MGESYAIYCEDRAGDSGPAESDMSACVRYLEVMLPVDDLKGASRAIAPGSEQTGRYMNQGVVHARQDRRTHVWRWLAATTLYGRLDPVVCCCGRV
jgi:hypothetical protein